MQLAPRRSVLSLAQSWLPVALLGVSLGFNIYLSYRIIHPSPQEAPHVARGDTFAALTAESMSGERVLLNFNLGHTQTVLYVFSPTCIWCARNLANVQALVAARGSSYRFIGVSLAKEGLTEYIRANGLPFPVYSVDPQTAKAAKLAGTPETIVISPDGKVQHEIRGAFTGAMLQQVEQIFDLRLPGLEQKGA